MNCLTETIHVVPEEGRSAGPGVMRTATGTAEVVRAAREIPAEVWSGTFRELERDGRYYQAIEETMPGKFEYRYLILRNEETVQAAVQPFFILPQCITEGLPAKFQRVVERVQKRFPRFLVMRVLMVGCAVGEGQVNTEEWAVRALHEVLDRVAKGERASIIVFKDYPARYRRPMEYFTDNGYCRVPSMPSSRVELTGYKDFEDYMQRRLSKVFRKNLRRKFRASEEIGRVEMTVYEDVSGMIDEVYPLYQQTLARAVMSFEVLTPEFLSRIGREMPDKARFFVWRLDGKIVAFNFCLLHGGVLYDMDIGLDYTVALDLHLYFVTWRDVFDWALSNGVGVYHTAPLNYDPKLHLRLELAPLDLYIRHTAGMINAVFPLAMGFLQPARHHPILREFPNADEL